MSRTEYNRPCYNKGVGGFDLAYHYEMVSDQERVSRIKAALDCVLTPDMTFCELGCGTGIFSLYAARTVKKVYAVEYDKATHAFAQKNFSKSELGKKITLINEDATKVKLPEKVDVIFAEMLSTALIHEPQVPVINHMGQFLKPGGIIIPDRVINIVELVNVDFSFEDIDLRTYFYEFSNIKKPRLLTNSKVYFSANFCRKVPMDIEETVTLKVITKGVANAIRLTSIVHLAGDINFFSTDSLMPPVVIPLVQDTPVSFGETFILNLKYQHRTDLNKVIAKIIGRG